MEATTEFEDLVEIIKRLRKECPWDRKQTHQSIKDNLIEEAYEAVDAIDQDNFEELKKELGDLLLHVVFHSTMASETGSFSIEDVILSIQEKLIRRHPHVFGNKVAEDEQQVAENWESIKMKEGKNSVLDGIPIHMPALIKAQRMQEKAANVGFDWPESSQVLDKVKEELNELREALEKKDKEESSKEFGDLLFSLVNLGRFYDINAEDALRMTNRKFEDRFRFVEESLAKEGLEINNATLEQMDGYWEEAKSNQ
ncbi:nucleoside triphosphate pyrophosphohydrolase [Aliifodinibius sp. S!AR15-10]|uniref:nucleoside triphosphate pyrophosphohydrolase n=1 Tax=Aliifodinibius sp. S!AR15-10 TaxID=2950437 RepID=UPI00285F3A9F|nr:nucleoside triphosphate pyrophosphohydrolase [Aliifodinibius sp. S!AR15-10]MDR8391792.1 nucleoside triphosphate pyrophosphohydrolase [Aliifodinibius sp. S!AR15-10]